MISRRMLLCMILPYLSTRNRDTGLLSWVTMKNSGKILTVEFTPNTNP